MAQYDYLIVGAGLFGAVFAERARSEGKRVLVLEKRPHIAGNCYTEKIAGIRVHRYGAHIFHTSDRKVWDYVNRFSEFNHFINAPVARYKNELYNLPFNMNTFTKLWPDVFTPEDARRRIAEEIGSERIGIPADLEEQAVCLVGRTIYEKLVKGYTEKQWGRSCKKLPAFIIRRLPVRFTFDNNYFNDRYQGIPVGGYTKMIESLLEGVEVRLNCDYLAAREQYRSMADHVVYTGPVDAYFGYRLGALEYRSLRFETEILDTPNFQGNAVVNYTAREVPFTRIIEHKWFKFGRDEAGNEFPQTVITREYSAEWNRGEEPYYPVNDEKNAELYQKYKVLASEEGNVLFGGRLGCYCYMDMDKTIASALRCAERELK